MPNLNKTFIESIFGGEVFDGHIDGMKLEWSKAQRPNDHYTLRLDTFYTFDPSEIGPRRMPWEGTYLKDFSLSGRVYNESNYIASIDQIPKVVSMGEGLGREDIKTFPFNIEDIELPVRSLVDKSNILDMRLVVEWWHLIAPDGKEENAFWYIPAKDITENLYLSKPIISFPEDTIRPMEIHSKAHLISGSEDGSSVLTAYSGWDKVAGVWFDENVNIQYSGKDRVVRTPSERAESFSIYEIPDNSYQHYENELSTQYRIVYSGEPADKYKDEREISFRRRDGETTSVERKINRVSSTGDFFDDWEVLSETAASPFVDSEIFSDYVSEKIPVEEEDIYEIVPYTGNIAGGQDYVEVDIIPDTGWSKNPDKKFPSCIKEDELFFRDGCNLRIRQEGGYDDLARSNFSEVMVYFQDTNSLPLSGYKVEFQNTPPDESRIYQLQNVADSSSDTDEVYFVGQAVGEGGSVGQAVYDSELFSIPQTDYEAEQGILRSSSESSRKLDSAIGFGMSESIPRGESIIPRTVPEEEYSNHVSGQKYIMSPHGAYSEYRSAKSFSSAGVLYSNFGEISFQSDFRLNGDDSIVDTYALYEQKLNIEDKVYSKSEKEIRIFKSGACDGLSLTHYKTSGPIDLPVRSLLDMERGLDFHDGWSINIQQENGRELGIRTGIISCEPQEGVDEENYFFSSFSGPKDKFLGYGRLNYFLKKDYVTGVNGDILQMVVYPDEKVEFDLPKDLFEGDSVYYVERDVYVDKNIDSQANDVEPEISQQNALSANIRNDTPYLTQTFHTLDKNKIHSSSPLRREYFNLQLETKEFLTETNIVSEINPVETENTERFLVIPKTEDKKGWMIQKFEGKYFPEDNKETCEAADGTWNESEGTCNVDIWPASSGGEGVVFTGLTVGHYYELQKRNNSTWETSGHPSNNKAVATNLEFTSLEDGTYRLKEWRKQLSYGEVAVKTKRKLGTEDAAAEYRLVELVYKFENTKNNCNWIINKNTFINSNKIYEHASKEKKDKSTIVGFWDLIDWLYDTSDIGRDDESHMELRYRNFISTAAYQQPSNPHITRNMEGTPLRSLRDFNTKLDTSEYEFNGARLPYYLEAKKGGKKEKGGDWIDGEAGYSYGDFLRLRVTRYVYRVYKKNAVLLGDLAKRDGVRDYGGWNFGLEKSVKSNGTWGSWQSANILSEGKISSSYYAATKPALNFDISYYSKGFDMVDARSDKFDSGSVLDAVMLETDATADHEPKDIRFRINKEQIIKTDGECKVQSKYNFFPINLSWDYLDGAVNLTDGLVWTDGSSENSIAGYQEITLTDTSTYSYAIVKAEGEEVKILNSDNEIIIYKMEEVEIPAPQYLTKFECEVCDGTWNAPESTTDSEHVGCTIKVSRRDRGTPLKVGEPTLIEGVTGLKIISDKTSGNIETKIKRLPLSYTIKQKTKINGGAEKVTHEEEVHGHNINSIRIGESGDEIYTLASDFECMNDANDLVSYEVTANIDDTSDPISVTVEQDDDFYNPPFQTSDFTVSGDNNIGGVFVCSGIVQASLNVTINPDEVFHLLNVASLPVTTSRSESLASLKGVKVENKEFLGETKSVTVLGEADYGSEEGYIVLSDYSRIPHQNKFDTSSDSYKLIEDENIYLEHSDDDEQIVFDCLSKVNLPKSPPAAFSFTGINIATEPIPMVSPDNHLIDGELVHYMKPRSEVRVSYANSAFSVDTLELESQASKLNIDQSKTAANQVEKFVVEDGGATVKGIYVADKNSLEVSVPNLSNGFKHAFVFKNNDPKENGIDFKDSSGATIGEHRGKYGVILKREDNKYIFESITAPRPKLGKNTNQDNDVAPRNANWGEIHAEPEGALTVNFLKLTVNTPEIVEYDASVFAGSGQHFYIKNETKEVKQVKLFYETGAPGKSYLGHHELPFTKEGGGVLSYIPVEGNGITRVEFNVLPDRKINNTFISFGQKKPVKRAIKVWDDEEENHTYANGIGVVALQDLPGDPWEWLSDVEGEELKFDDGSPLKSDENPSGLLNNGDYYFSTNKNSNDERFVLVASAFEAGVEPVVKFSDSDKFKVMVIPDSPFHRGMDENGTYLVKGASTVSEDDDEPFTKNEQYILDYCNAADGLKVCTVPLFNEIGRNNRHDPKVLHKGREISDSYGQTTDPYLEDKDDRVVDSNEDDLDESQCEDYEGCVAWFGGYCWFPAHLAHSSYPLSFQLSGEVITVESLLIGQASQSDNYVVADGEKIVRIVSENVTKVNLTKVGSSSNSVILIINELPVDDQSSSIIVEAWDKTNQVFNSTELMRRSAIRAVYNNASDSYSFVQVQFYEIVYHYIQNTDAKPWDGWWELNKFYEKSEYDGKVLLFNTSVKIEGSSTATKWIDLNKHICTDEDALQITYAYSTDPVNGEYSILDSPLYVRILPENGYVINKSNSVVSTGWDSGEEKYGSLLYSDEVWHETEESNIATDGYLHSPNLRSEDYFIKLYNHIITPKAKNSQDEQREIVNFCRLNKLSPRAGLLFDGRLLNITNEQGEDWPDVEPYKYGITLYGNKLNSSKKINFEFNYYDLLERKEVYNDLIYGKRIPSRALANTIGFSINTGNESIIKCVFFNERTGEATFSGINKDKEYVVLARDYRSSTNPMDFITDQDESLEESVPYVMYNGDEYLNGETFIGKGDVSTYSISSLDFANVKVSLLSDLVEEKIDTDGSLVKVDPVIHPEAETTTVEDEVVPEPAWRVIPDDDKAITVVENPYTDDGSYQDGATDIIVDNVTSTAADGDVYLFSGGISFAIDMIAGTDPPSSRQTLYGTLIGGNLASGATGIYNPSKEIKESNRWGTVIKSSEMLSGYRWSNFLIRHTSGYSKIRDLLENDKDKYYFITIKKHEEITQTHDVTDTTGLIKIEEDKNNIYIFRRATLDDPPFNKYSKIEGVELTESNVPDGIARVKIGKNDIFIPDNSYTIITTDNQAFKEEISISESKTAAALSRQTAPAVSTVYGVNLQQELTTKVMAVSAEEVLDNKNKVYEDVALNPTKNYANQVGIPNGISFYVGEGNQAVDKLRIRLSRLVGKKVILKDYSNNLRVKNLEKNGIVHQLKYILEGETKSAYAYDEMVYKGTVNIGSVLFGTSGLRFSNPVTIDEDTINHSGLLDGDAIVFDTWDGNTHLQINKVYFIKLTGTANTYNLYRAEKLTDNFKETFSTPTMAEFRVVSRAEVSSDFCAISSIEGNSNVSDQDHVIVNETCFRNRTVSGDNYIKLGLETYSFEYREIEPDGVQYPLSVGDVIFPESDIFESRNNFAKNFYVLRYHKNDKKTVTFHLTKGRTYRYFIKSNVNKIVYGPDTENDKLESTALGTKGTFEAKQEQVEIVFNKDVEIGKTISAEEETVGPIGTVGNIVGYGGHTDASPHFGVELEGDYGTGAIANVEVASNWVYSVTITDGGSGYKVGDELTIPASVIGGNEDAYCDVLSLLRTSAVKDISSHVCILEELKYEETNKELICKPHSDGPIWSGGGSEVDDKGIHGIFKSKSNTWGGTNSGMDDVLFNWDLSNPVFDKFLPEKIDTIHPHIKKIEGGDNVQLSWTMGDKYWDGFWLNEKKYLPKSYKYTVHRKRGGEDEEIFESENKGEGIAGAYSYPKVTADVNLYSARVLTVGDIVSAGDHTYVGSGDPHLIENIELSGGSKWETDSPRAMATVEILSDLTIGSVTVTEDPDTEQIGGEGYGKGDKLTIPANKIGGAGATCVVTKIEAIDLSKRSSHKDYMTMHVYYDKDSLRHTIKSHRSGFLEYIPGSNEKHLLYDRKKYSSKSIFPYNGGKKIQIIGKDLEPFQRRTFNPEDYEEGDTFYVKVSEELLHIAGAAHSSDSETLKKLTSNPMRLPLNWASSFSASDIQDSQKFRDTKRDVDKVRLEVIANSDNKGIELPESLLQVIVPHSYHPHTDPYKAFPGASPLPVRMPIEGEPCLEMIRNLFFKITFTSARACIYDPIVEGRISNVKLSNNGENYLSEPTVTLDPPTAGYKINDGTGNMIPFHRQSEGGAKLDAQGKISQIIVTDPGSGYGWKEGGYQYERTDVKPIVYSLFKIKSGEVQEHITGINDEKFFSYDYQLANGTSRKIDPVSVTIEANPEDAESNILSMGMTRAEFAFVNNLYSKDVRDLSEGEENYKASKMLEKTFIGGSPRSPDAGLSQGTHQDNLDDLTEGPVAHGFISTTPDEEGGQGGEDDTDATLDTSPQGTSRLDNRETDPTSSETDAKALGVVNDVSLADYRIRRSPFSKTSYPWISGMSSSTRPDYPMFFGNAPGTEISADAFNNMVDAVNSLDKVNIDLPVYVRIKKHIETTYRHVPDWGLRSKSTIDKINQYFEDNPLTEYGIDDIKDPRYVVSDEEAEIPVVLKEGNIICGTTNKDGSKIYTAEIQGRPNLPLDELSLYSVNQRRIATSITAGTLIGSFNEAPEIYVKEISSIGSLELYSQVDHRLIYGCFSKGDSIHQLFIETTLIWCEYEILPFGNYAEAALGKDLLSNLDKNKTIYEGVLSTQETSCSWGARPFRDVLAQDAIGNKDQFNVCPRGTSPFLADVDVGTVRSGPIELDLGQKNSSIIASANGIIKIDPVAEVGGLISAIYGRIATRTFPPLGSGYRSCLADCLPYKAIWLTFPRGKNNGFILNLDITKTDGADCF